MVLDNLAVSITSQVADVKAGISSVRSSFVDLAAASQGTAGRLDEASDEMDEVTRSSIPLIGSLQVLQGRLDETGDEARELGTRSGFAAGLVTSLGISSEGASVGVSALSTSLTLSLIPAVLTLATILAPLTATLAVLAAVTGGVAGGFAAVIGTGILAGFEELKELAKDTLDILQGLLVGVGEEFAPLIRDALFALPGLLADIITAAGDLTPFADALRQLGGIAQSSLPGLVAELAELGRNALPNVVGAFRTIAQDGPAAFAILQESANDAIPVLREIGAALIANGPAILEFGTNVLEVVGPALVELINIGGDVASFINNLSPLFRDISIAISVLLPAITGLIGLFGGFSGIASVVSTVVSGVATVLTGLVSILGGPVTLAIVGVIGLIAAWETNFLGFRDVVLGIIDTLSSEFDGFVSGINDMIRGAIQGLNDFIRAANDVPGVNIDPIATPQTSTGQFSQNRQQQRQMIDVRIQSDDEKFEAEVRELSGGEFVRLQNAQSDRADRINPS